MSTSISLDIAAGVAYISLNEDQIEQSIETANGIVLDLNSSGFVVGIEILDLSSTISIDEIRSLAHLNSADDNHIRSGFQTLNRMKLTSGSLTTESKVQVHSNNGLTLEAS